MEGNMAIFGYGRVSTGGQTAENQRLEIERAGYAIDYWFEDTISGKSHSSQRPQFGKMVEKLRGGDVLVVSKLDRLGRDAPDVLATVKSLTSMNVEVVVLQLGKLDLGTAAGKLMLAMLAAIAEMERDLLVERTNAGLVRVKREGKKLGRPTKTTQEQRAAIARALRSNARSVSDLAKTYNISRATVLAIAKRENEK
jgi:DNA invertase Pin-like site-specific DNA recombinase